MVYLTSIPTKNPGSIGAPRAGGAAGCWGGPVAGTVVQVMHELHSDGCKPMIWSLLRCCGDESVLRVDRWKVVVGT